MTYDMILKKTYRVGIFGMMFFESVDVVEAVLGPSSQTLKQCQASSSQSNIGKIVFTKFLSKMFLLDSSKKVKEGIKLAYGSNLKNCGTFTTLSMVSFPVEGTSTNV